MIIRKERLTAEMPGDFVVFLIGMRVNRWWRVDKWLPVVFAMGRMLRELNSNRDLGFLGASQWLGRTTIMVSYFEYAKNRTASHLPAWRAFNQAVGTSGTVGIWHETYRVAPGDYESVYVNMPAFGLGEVGELVPAVGARQMGQERMRLSHETRKA